MGNHKKREPAERQKGWTGVADAKVAQYRKK